MRYFLFLGLLGLVSCTKEPNVAVRIDCGDYNDKGLQTSVNGKAVGDCPIDILVHAGDLTVNARKDNEDASYLYGEAKMTLANNAMKRIKLDVQIFHTDEYYYRQANSEVGMEEYLRYSKNEQRKNEVIINLEKIRFNAVKDLQSAQKYLVHYPDSFRYIEVGKIMETEKLRKIEEDQKAEKKKFIPFADNKDGTATDQNTGLTWMRCSYGQEWNGASCKGHPKELTWHEAINIKFKFAGHDDWRLPSISEMLTLTKCKSGREDTYIPENGKYTHGRTGQCLDIPRKETHSESDLSVNAYVLKGFFTSKPSYTWIFFTSTEPQKYNSLGVRDVFIYYPLSGGWGTTSRDEENMVRFVRGELKN